MKIAYLNDDNDASPPGHLPTSRYVRRYWSPLLGTAAVGCFIVITEAIDDGRTSIPPLEIAEALGLESPTDLTQPIANLARSGLAVAINGQVLVRRTAPTLRQEYEYRLPPALREAHRRLRSQGLISSSPPQPAAERTGHDEVDRARLLALSLLRMGLAPERLEDEMHRRRLHPALAYQASVWAIERHVPASDSICDEREIREICEAALVPTSDQSA
ncbi:MAG: hypothetical protein DCC49_07170 [Acidobacteria bacterium]|nr:MAG: hypothetical protein DCC49_07170 [Acidobacteriota bacterium]